MSFSGKNIHQGENNGKLGRWFIKKVGSHLKIELKKNFITKLCKKGVKFGNLWFKIYLIISPGKGS